MEIHPELRRAALLLAVVQFFFFTTWVVYVTYLGDLLDQVGIGRANLIWFVLADQLVFAVTDTLMGFSADRVERFVGRLGPMIITVNGISCLAFLLVPQAATLGPSTGPVVFTGLLLAWIGTSSVLRAPPMVLLMKHAARPQAPRLAALSLVGLALAGALAPFIGLWLKSMSPTVPFVVTSLTLFAVTLGLIHVQRIIARLPTEARAPDDAQPAKTGSLVPFFLGTLLVALGFQVHYFLNSKAQYLRFLDPADLVWVLPLFWVGFKLLVFPGSTAATRYGPLKVMVAAAVLGGFGLVGAALAPSFGVLIAAQMLAGGCWGVAFMAGISAALGMGSSGREGLVLGLWFTMVSLATAVRVGLAIGAPKLGPGAAELLPWMPVAAWAAGAAILAYLGWRYRPRLATSGISV